jgi:hypothetical protein
MNSEPDLNVFGDGQDPTAEQIAVIVKTDIQKAQEEANAIMVIDQASLNTAELVSQDFKRRQKVIDTRFAKLEKVTKEAKQKTDETRSALLALVKELKAPFDAAMRIIDWKCRTWKEAEQKRLNAIAEEARKKEQKRLDDEKAAALKDAAAKGDAETFKAIEKKEVVAIVEAPKIQSVAGTSYMEKWEAVLWVPDGADITNEDERRESALLKLVKAISAGEAPLELVTFNNVAANAMARRMKAKMNYPGILVRDAGKTSHRV